MIGACEHVFGGGRAGRRRQASPGRSSPTRYPEPRTARVEAGQHPLWMYDKTTDATYYFELDTLGNVRRLRGGQRFTTGAPALPSDLGGYRYTAFGRTVTAADTPAPVVDGVGFDQPLRWQGRWYSDLAGGLYDFRNRVWSPRLGAFVMADEFGFLTGTGTLWSWPGQNPYTWRDPSGLVPLPGRVQRALQPYYPSIDLSQVDVVSYAPVDPSSVAETSGGYQIRFAGQVDPYSTTGMYYLAHELQHVQDWFENNPSRLRRFFAGLSRRWDLDWQKYKADPKCYEISAQRKGWGVVYDLYRHGFFPAGVGPDPEQEYRLGVP